MELLSSETHFIVVDGNHSLWIDRKNGSFTAKTEDYDELITTSGAQCLGTVYGFIGKLHYNDSAEPRLVFVQKRSKVGEIKGCELYKICSIVTIPLETESELLLEPCCKTHKKSGASKAFTSIEPATGTTSTNNNGRTASSALQKVTSAAGNSSKLLSFPAIPKRNDKVVVDKIERRMLDEFHKMFTEADSFFYSTTYDITNTVQRSFHYLENLQEGSEVPAWKRADSRFFWNIHLLTDLIDSKDPTLDRWILPIMQGFVQQENCDVNQFEVLGPELSGTIELYLISRRSRFRAGTRYLRRGVDENGKVANYVETEQILAFKGHVISFVQLRGSIPVFWSQPGYKYRPPPRLDRSDDENMTAFTNHFQEEESIYGPITAVNLVEKGGKEKVLGDAYLDYVIKYNSSNVSYFAYDFHENCRGMRFENVATLVEKLSVVLKNMNYCWVDSYGMVLRQDGVCRVNCVDCLDRTNVVETHIAKHMLVVQLSKLGLLVPDVGLPNNIKSKLQVLWANNGDTISKQYAGTNALKGDFTRTGERRLAGVMKDGMNSANRYYLNRFKDTSRQAAIDVILGIKTNITEEDLDGEKPAQDEKENTAEQIKQVIDDVKKCIVPTFDVVLGAWGLVNAKTNEPDSMDIDTIFILTDSHYYVTEYDCMLDALTETQKVPLSALESIEIGNEPVNQPSANLWSLFHSNSNSVPKGIPNIRLNYEQGGQLLYHQFRSSNVRFFNNVIITVNHNPEEMLESLKMFAEAVEAAMSIVGKKISVTEMPFLPVKEGAKPSTTPGMAPSWVSRYFSFGNEGEVDKLSTADLSQGSSQEKTRIYRRGSLISTPSQADSGIESVSESNSAIQSSKKKYKGGDELGSGDVVGSDEEVLGKPLSVDEIVLSMTPEQSYTVDDKKDTVKLSARTPVEGFRSFLLPSKDLVLPSCGIVSVHENNFTSSLSALLSAHELIIDVDGLASPVTPTAPTYPSDFGGRNPSRPSDDSNRSCNNESSPGRSPTSSERIILQRHRHSLPVNSLGLNQTGISLLLRPVTPEITITEEPSNTEEHIRIDKGFSPAAAIVSTKVTSAKLSVIQKRMTRSSEDVNRIPESTINPTVVSRMSSTYNKFGGLKLGRLSPSISSENRASSDLDIFGSLVNMKGSLSDSRLRENNQSSNNNKKDLVFSPLGKLARGMQNIGANYLDPRKLKGSFKQTRLENMKLVTHKKEEPSKEENAVLQERIKTCKSLIVDV